MVEIVAGKFDRLRIVMNEKLKRHWAACEAMSIGRGVAATEFAAGYGRKVYRHLANEINLKLTVCHFPPGTSKWNKIEHRMFCHITENWRGRPLVSRAVIVNLIGNTTTSAGLTINADVDTNSYPKGVKVSDKELATINIKKHTFYGDWNYTIAPDG